MSFKWRHISRRSFLVLVMLPCLAPTSGHATETLTFAQLCKSFGVRGMGFSDRLLALRGNTVSIEGYMAPALKAESNFFVLNPEPVAL